MSFQNNKGVNLPSGNNSTKCLCMKQQSYKSPKANVDRTERRNRITQL